MSNPYLAEIRAFGFNFAPRGWALCQGQIMAISQNTALFSLLGTSYGGNGQTTFALPDLRGRTLTHQGTGLGLSQYVVGEQVGSEFETLLITETPNHGHPPLAKTQAGTANMHTTAVAGDYMSRFNASSTAFGQTWNNPPLENGSTLSPTTIGLAGGGLPHENRQPLLVINYCICVSGTFPARN
jgi:microcystin-dependent protein